MVTVDTTQLERAALILADIPRGVEKAASRAVNRALVSARAQAIESIRGEYEVKAGAIRKTIKLSKATPSNPGGTVTSTGSMIPLVDFAPSPSTPGTGGPGRPALTVSVKRGKREQVDGGFIMRNKSGHVGVFKRVGPKRSPLHQLYGPAVPIMMGAADVAVEVEEAAQLTLAKRFDHEVTRLLEGAS